MKINKIIILSVLITAIVSCGGSNSSQTKIPIPKEDPPVFNIRDIAKNIDAKLIESEVNDDFINIFRNKIKENFIRSERNSLNNIKFSEEVCRNYPRDIIAYDDAQPSHGDTDEVSNFTTTNIQEKRVDEADIIKTDGEYIFALSGNKINIFKAWPVNDFELLEVISLDEIDGYGNAKMYLQDDSLTVFSQIYHRENQQHQSIIHHFNRNGGDLELNYLKNLPASFGETRLIDGNLLMVGRYHLLYDLYRSPIQLDIPTDSLIDLLDSDEEIKEYFCTGSRDRPDNFSTWNNEWNQELDSLVKTALLASIEVNGNSYTSVDNYLSNHYDSKLNETFDNEGFCNQFYFDKNNNELTLNDLSSLLVVSNLNLNSPESHNTSCVEAFHSRFSYVGQDGVYVVEKYDHRYGGINQASDAGVVESVVQLNPIHYFNIGKENQINYKGSVVAPGRILNSFSMSEYGAYLRIATTVETRNENNRRQISNAIYTIDRYQEGLPIVGEINNIAPGETIYSARFLRDKGYLVTFRKVDPFYVIDLADHEKPQIAGELKIPGYSNYLHILDDNHVIGLGKDTEEALNGNFAWFQGVKLSLFDVTDPQNPIEEDKEIIGDRGSSSYALFDHHAFSFLPESNLLALPVEYYEGERDLNSYGDFSYTGIHLYHIDPEDGIELDRVIQFDEDDSCVSEISRVIIFEDEDHKVNLYALRGNSLIQVKIGQDSEEMHSLSMSENNCEFNYDLDL
jgi:hypothetical protein